MPKQRVYIETSVVGYLRHRQSEQIVPAARQLITKRWWDEQRPRYELVTSQAVIEEVSRGDPELAKDRLDAISGIGRVEFTEAAGELAEQMIARRILPQKARLDAIHLSLASVHQIDLLTHLEFRSLGERGRCAARSNFLRRGELLDSDNLHA